MFLLCGYVWWESACEFGQRLSCGKYILYIGSYVYSYGRVTIDTWRADEYEIKLDCVWDYPSAHTHVSAAARVWAIQNKYHFSDPQADSLE